MYAGAVERVVGVFITLIHIHTLARAHTHTQLTFTHKLTFTPYSLIFSPLLSLFLDKGQPTAGEEVYVYDHKENIIGRGFFNPHSQYRVRMICQQSERALFDMTLHSLLSARIKNAKELRAQISLPSSSNSVYRLINGEGLFVLGSLCMSFFSFYLHIFFYFPHSIIPIIVSIFL